MDTLKSLKKISPDHHLDWVDPDAQAFVFGDDKRDAAAAVSYLCVEVQPLARRRLGHDVQVDLQTSAKRSATITEIARAGLGQRKSSPSLQPASPCPEGRT